MNTCQFLVLCPSGGWASAGAAPVASRAGLHPHPRARRGRRPDCLFHKRRLRPQRVSLGPVQTASLWSAGKRPQPRFTSRWRQRLQVSPAATCTTSVLAGWRHRGGLWPCRGACARRARAANREGCCRGGSLCPCHGASPELRSTPQSGSTGHVRPHLPPRGRPAATHPSAVRPTGGHHGATVGGWRGSHPPARGVRHKRDAPCRHTAAGATTALKRAVRRT